MTEWQKMSETITFTGSGMSDETFNVLTQQLDLAKARSYAELNRAMYTSAHVPAPIVRSWRDHLWRSVARVRGYVSTLWRAMKGEDPYDVDYDY